MHASQTDIAGPLQAKIMMMLRDEPLCGVDIMNRLKIKSPGTIYPVLEALRKRQLIDYTVEPAGATRKKTYFLTSTGKQQIREYLALSARAFCCDASLHLKRILENVKGLIDINRHRKILCTLEYDEVKRFLSGADVTFSYDIDVPSNTYDLALSLLGVGLLLGKNTTDITDYVSRLHRSLKEGGSLLAIEIEKTDNILARIFFEDIVGLKESPGLEKDELESILERIGFRPTRIIRKSGLLYALTTKI